MEEVKTNLRKTSGRFNEKNFLELLKKTRDEFFSGKLLIKAREGFGTILFREGNIVSASTPLLKERLGERLVKNGVFTPDDLKMATQLQNKHPKRHLESILVEEGYLKQELLFQILKEISEDVIFGMMFWNGVYRFEKITPPLIPDNYLITVDQFVNKMDSSIDDMIDFERDGFFKLDTDNAGSSHVHTKQADTKAEIDKTLRDVAKSLTTFKPRELVIVVEDETLMRTMLSDGLKNFDFEVETYDNAKNALVRIQELESDRISPVIILDLVMAGLYDDKDVYGGIDILNYISQNFPVIPVIITTSVADTEIRLKTQFLGATCFLNKPTRNHENSDRFSSNFDRFVEEISYCLENIFRRHQAYLEKDQLASVREELLNQILKKGNVSFRSIEDILKAKILVIDDEKEICGLCEEFLGSEGFINITISTDSEAAIKKFTEIRHDVVITDIIMPKKNGIEILKYVKTASPNSQVIIITGHADKNTSIAAVKLGAFDYIEKPIDFETLGQNVKKAVEKKFVLDEKI